MFGYNVDIERICTHSEREDVEWGSWSESYDNYFNSITKTKEGGYPDITSSIEIKEGEDCFVVWAEWSSGDSFGSGDRNYVEPLAVFKDPESCRTFVTACNRNKDYSFKVATQDGQVIEVYAGWVGYFESLNNINIEQTTIKYKFQ